MSDERKAAIERALVALASQFDDETIRELARGGGWAQEAVKAVPTDDARVRACVRFTLWFDR